MRTDRLNMAFKAVAGEGVKKMLIHVLWPFRNRFILFNVSNHAKPNAVNLDYWDESDNLGDTLSPVINNYMLSLKGIDPEKHISQTRHLYGTGSVLTAGIQDAAVWGSGVLNTCISYRLKNRRLDIRSVRGPYTRAVLMDYGYDVPAVYGDPAILMPEIYKLPDNIQKTHRFGVILHKDDKRTVPDGAKRISINTDDYEAFINEIASCGTVISSSLHGIILSEAYGIPAVLLKPSKDFIKYFDYYSSTGRIAFPMADSIEAAMQTEPSPLPDLNPVREKIKGAYPYDIYD